METKDIVGQIELPCYVIKKLRKRKTSKFRYVKSIIDGSFYIKFELGFLQINTSRKK